jgi:hypothetical protein
MGLPATNVFLPVSPESKVNTQEPTCGGASVSCRKLSLLRKERLVFLAHWSGWVRQKSGQMKCDLQDIQHTTGNWGVLLYIDTLAHNQSGIAYRGQS